MATVLGKTSTVGRAACTAVQRLPEIVRGNAAGYRRARHAVCVQRGGATGLSGSRPTSTLATRRLEPIFVCSCQFDFHELQARWPAPRTGSSSRASAARARAAGAQRAVAGKAWCVAADC